MLAWPAVPVCPKPGGGCAGGGHPLLQTSVPILTRAVQALGKPACPKCWGGRGPQHAGQGCYRVRQSYRLASSSLEGSPGPEVPARPDLSARRGRVPRHRARPPKRSTGDRGPGPRERSPTHTPQGLARGARTPARGETDDQRAAALRLETSSRRARPWVVWSSPSP